MKCDLIWFHGFTQVRTFVFTRQSIIPCRFVRAKTTFSRREANTAERTRNLVPSIRFYLNAVHQAMLRQAELAWKSWATRLATLLGIGSEMGIHGVGQGKRHVVYVTTALSLSRARVLFLPFLPIPFVSIIS